MLVQFLCIQVVLLFRRTCAQDDLEIVGSDKHFAFEPKIGKSDGAGYYRPAEEYTKASAEDDEPKINFPVQTVQKFTDSDGNIKIVTSYSNRHDSPLPIYKDAALRTRGVQQARGYRPVVEVPTNQPRTRILFPSPVVPAYEPQYEQQQQRYRPVKQEYIAKKTIKLPNQDTQIFAKEKGSTSKDGSSSSYNQKTSYKTKYKKPQETGDDESDTNTNLKSDEPVPQVEEAGTSFVSDIDEAGDIDEGFVDDRGSFNKGASYSGLKGGTGSDFVNRGPAVFEQVEEDGFDEPIERHRGFGGGGILNHGHDHSHGQSFKKGHAASYQHGDKAAKGDEGGKGYKKQEKYEKGHEESHGREEQKGGQKEESGGKTGHLDEGTQYAKGHAEAHGSKGNQGGHSKGHKKGHKTKGFRTVHHKDEYKKDEEFYDEEHDAGHNKGHGEDHHSHKHVKGGDHKKGHIDSGYKHAQKGFHGDKEKGHSYQNEKGKAGSVGSKHHHSEHAHFDKAAGHKGEEAHGEEHYSKGH